MQLGERESIELYMELTRCTEDQARSVFIHLCDRDRSNVIINREWTGTARASISPDAFRTKLTPSIFQALAPAPHLSRAPAL